MGRLDGREVALLTLNGRVGILEGRAGRRPPPADLTRRAVLRRLSVDELEALEGAITALEGGEPLTAAQRAAVAAWERLASADDPEGGGGTWSG